ncbi:MAG: hypothetical protein ACR2IF_07090 [Terriglobales bacterium]
MIEKFNFYDLYGYLLPGLTLAGLLWAPFGYLSRSLPAKEISSALIVILAAYLLGHLLQTALTNAIPSKIGGRAPSDRVIDDSDDTFDPAFRAEIAAAVRGAWAVDIKGDASTQDKAAKELSELRNKTFFLCREVLIQNELASYGEQFEGLYTFMRGEAISFVLGAVYFLGWTAAVYDRQCLRITADVMISVALLLLVGTGTVRLVRRRTIATVKVCDQITLYSLCGALLPAGYMLALHRSPNWHASVAFGIAAAICTFAALRFFAAYYYFALQFANAIWRGFVAYWLVTRRAKA